MCQSNGVEARYGHSNYQREANSGIQGRPFHPACLHFTLLLIDSSNGIISPGTEDPARLYYNSNKVTGVCTLAVD